MTEFLLKLLHFAGPGWAPTVSGIFPGVLPTPRNALPVLVVQMVPDLVLERPCNEDGSQVETGAGTGRHTPPVK